MPAYTIGLDLGQANDYSALAVVEHVWEVGQSWIFNDRGEYRSPSRFGDRAPARAFLVRKLLRWERGTPYPSVVDDVADVLSREEFRDDAQLIYDATGVGRAVGDLLQTAWRSGRAGHRAAWPFTFTAESKVGLFSTALVALQNHRLRVGDGSLTEDLLSELPRFEQKITASGRATVDISRDSKGHGDLVTAVLIALAYGDMIPAGEPRTIEVPENQQP